MDANDVTVFSSRHLDILYRKADSRLKFGNLMRQLPLGVVGHELPQHLQLGCYAEEQPAAIGVQESA